MRQVVTATEARIRFGELIRQVVETQKPVVVQRGGKPWVVILSVEEYERLKAARDRESWRETVKKILEMGTRLKTRRKGKPLTSPEKVIRKLREERDVDFSGLR